MQKQTKGKPSRTAAPVRKQVQKVKADDNTKNFLNDGDVKASNAALSSAGMNLTIEKGRTPVYFLSAAYADGYVHWVGSGGKSNFRVVCGGGLEGKGYAPESCKVCKWMSEVYDKATQLQSAGKPKQAQVIRNTANAVHAKYELLFVAAKGEMLVSKDKRTGKKVGVPDFDEAEVGTLSMTKKQWQDFQGLVEGGRYDEIESKKDLFNRIIIIDKRNRATDGKKDRYPTVEFIPSKKQSDAPIEVDLKDYPLGERFIVEAKTIDEVAQMLRHGKVKKDEAEYEDEEALDDYLDDDNDVPDESDDGGDAVEEVDDDDNPDDVVDADDEFDDSFLSDDDEEEVDEAPAPKRPPVKSRPGAVTGTSGRKTPPRRKADF